MTVEELEQDVREVLAKSDWTNVQVREHGGEWVFTINGSYFKTESREKAFQYLGAFFMKASTICG